MAKAITIVGEKALMRKLNKLAGSAQRRIALPASVKHWTLTTLREKLIKIGGKMVHHARYVTFQLAEVAVPRRLSLSNPGS